MSNFYTGTATVAVVSGTATITKVSEGTSGTFALLVAGSTIQCSGGMGFVDSNADDVITVTGWGGAASATAVAWKGVPPSDSATYAVTALAILQNTNALNSLPSGRILKTAARDTLMALDCLVGCCLISMTLITPPSAPATGDAYVVPTGATGAWASYVGKVAYCLNGAWLYLAPYQGLQVYCLTDSKLYIYKAGAFVDYLSTVPLAGGVLASGKMLVGNASGAAAAVALSGDVSVDSAGAATVKKIGGHEVTVSGAGVDGTLYSLSFTLNGATAVTFPTSGTLALLEKAQTWTAYQTEDITGAAYHNLRGSTTETFYNIFNAAMPSGSRNWRIGCNTGTGTLCIDALNDAGSSVTGRVTMTSAGVLGSNAIKFPETQVVSSDANTLDDYEKGTGSVAISATGSAPTCTYNFNSLVYRKIGDTVWVRFGIKLASVSGGSGGVIITGLPFTSAYFGSYKNPTARVETGWLTTAANAANVRIYVSDSSTFLGTRLIDNADNSLDVSQLTANTFIGGEIFYQVA